MKPLQEPEVVTYDQEELGVLQAYTLDSIKG